MMVQNFPRCQPKRGSQINDALLRITGRMTQPANTNWKRNRAEPTGRAEPANTIIRNRKDLMSTPSNSGNEGSKRDPSTFSQDVQISNISARVPEKVARGVFATGVLVLQGGTEFVLDFVLRMNQPHQIVARVFLPFTLVPQLINTLNANLENYRQKFGAAPLSLPIPPPKTTPPTIEEIYQDLKFSEDVMIGVYANSAMIVHSATEFGLEFICNSYPKAVIVARVFLSAPQVPVMLQSLTQSWQRYQSKMHPPQPPNPTPP
jgi:Protein of unknown function (DUF3467)